MKRKVQKVEAASTTSATTIAIDSVVPMPKNAKKHDVNAIIASIAANGFVEPLVVNTITGHLLSGHGRAEALRRLKANGAPPPRNIVVGEGGRWEAPCWYLEVEPEREYAVSVTVNRLVEKGGWEWQTLAEALEEIRQAGVDIESTGFSNQELDQLIANIAPTTPAEEWDGMPEFLQEDKMGVRKMIVHFATHEDVDRFGAAIGQTFTDKTKSIWYPEAEKIIVADKRYATTEEAEAAE